MDCRIKIYSCEYPFIFCTCKFEEYVNFLRLANANDIEWFSVEVYHDCMMSAFHYVTHYIYTYKMQNMKKLIIRNKTTNIVNINFEKIRPYMPNLRELYVSGFNVLNINDITQGLVILDIQKCTMMCSLSLDVMSCTMNHLSLLKNKYVELPSVFDFSRFGDLYSLEISGLTMCQPPILPSDSMKLIVILISQCRFGADCQEDNLSTSDLSTWHIPESVTELVLSKCNIDKFPLMPSSLQHLDISENKSLLLPPNIVTCIQLREFVYDTAKIVLQLNEQRFLERLYVKLNLYNQLEDYHQDLQNVHNSHVQKSLVASIQKLFSVNYPKSEFLTTGSQAVDAIIVKLCKLKEIHSILNVTYQEVFEKVWDRIAYIADPVTKSNVMSRFCEEIMDSEDKCFLGMLSRLVNSLCGFYDDIHINIGTSEQIVSKMRAHFKTHGKVNREALIRELSEITTNPQIAIEYVDEFVSSINDI